MEQITGDRKSWRFTSLISSVLNICIKPVLLTDRLMVLPNLVVVCPLKHQLWWYLPITPNKKRPASSSPFTLAASLLLLTKLTSHGGNSCPICLMTRPHHPFCSRCQSPTSMCSVTSLTFQTFANRMSIHWKSKTVFTAKKQTRVFFFQHPFITYTRSK